MSPLRRALVAAAVLAAAGCAVPPPAPAAGVDPQRPYDGLAFDISQVPPELRVPEPKDARGITACDLLTDAQLVEVGLRPETAEVAPAPRGTSCHWQAADDPQNFANAGTGAQADYPALLGIYAQRGRAVRFEPLSIAGHPGVRADIIEGACDITVAASDDQTVGADGNGAAKPMPDECARSRRMVELILSNLPPRR